MNAQQRPEGLGRIGERTSGGTRPRPDDGDPHFAGLVARLTERLRPVCAEWDEANFQALVRDIARFKVQWGELDHLDRERDM